MEENRKGDTEEYTTRRKEGNRRIFRKIQGQSGNFGSLSDLDFSQNLAQSLAYHVQNFPEMRQDKGDGLCSRTTCPLGPIHKRSGVAGVCPRVQ